ncbi:Nuclear transcription factor Y subunit B-9 [Spatholobus suberectus]|nr:Nuclear transcription factor Y subunit B-9 [Spatholobus suberectus]
MTLPFFTFYKFSSCTWIHSSLRFKNSTSKPELFLIIKEEKLVVFSEAMEHGDSFFHYDQHAKSSSGSIIPMQQANTSANIEIPPHINSSNGDPVPNLAVRDKSKMPITNVTKIMRQTLPNNAKFSDGAKEMIQQSATKYITFVTRKAKERCQSEYRKILNAEDLLWAIEKLGFDDYVGPLTTFMQRYRNIEGGDPFTRCGEPISCIDNNGLTLGPEPNPVPTLERLPPPLPPPVHSSGSDFSMDPNTNLEMFDPNDVNEFFLDGFCVDGSDDAFNNFGASALFKHDQV